MTRNIVYYIILLKSSLKLSLKSAWSLPIENGQAMECKPATISFILCSRGHIYFKYKISSS